MNAVSNIRRVGFVVRCLTYSLLGILLVAVSLRAQTSEITFQGKVLDPSRGTVAGAEISVVPQGAGARQSTVSDSSGEFSLTLLPGKYMVNVVATGFERASQAVELENASSQEFVLKVAGVNAIVTVQESPGYQVSAITSATKTLTPLRDVPQAIAVVTQQQIHEQSMQSVGDVVRYIPGITAHQGENNRDQVIIRGNSSSADFFVNGFRDDVQYYRDLYNVERVEALKGPNAMIFGRGGGGGIINRVTKEAIFMPLRELSWTGGSNANRRFTADLNQPLTGRIAARLNGMYENSDSFRNYVNLERYGIHPSLTFAASNNTGITLAYERFHDGRVADRGITSFQGAPAPVDISTYYGNPDASHVRADVNLASAAIDHRAGKFSVQNRVSFADYDRDYQNFVPGAVNSAKTLVALSAYNNATGRRNFFNQTNMVYAASTGRIRHTLLAGAEAGRQLTDNFRNTGFFNNTATSINVPYDAPTIQTPVIFRQSATDADNHLKTNLAAAYVQDQIDVSRRVQVIGGIRFDYFDLTYHNNRNGDQLRRIDRLASPRAGIVFKPTALMSIYSSYSVSYLPSSGDQFSSLTTVTQQVKPERFTNYEAGIKWDLRQDLSLTTALYRLDRSNTRSTDPNDPTRIVQTGSTRSNGFEIGLNGKVTRSWRLTGGYAYQDAFIARATTSAPAGAQVAQVPHHTFSVWNNYRIVSRVAAGLGIIRRSDMFAAIDNTVTLPAYTRADAAVFVSLREHVRFQANVENLLDKRYYINADSNTNISPGASRTVRMGLTTNF